VKVLLLQDVKSVGKAGEVKDVSDGYFRNLLAPKGLATPATEGALKRVAEDRESAARKQSRAANENRKLADVIKGTRLTFRVRVGEQHRLFGAVTTADIAVELAKTLGRDIDKRQIHLEEAIRHLGTYEVPVHLATGIEPKLTVVVEPLESSAG
jgi:large subunit ribosomal protein L9